MLLGSEPMNPNSKIFIPGKPVASRNSITASSIKPKSSAIIGKSPSSFFTASNKSNPGPFTHSPPVASVAPAGISQ